MSNAAQAALNNADWMFLLRQKPESVLALEKADKLVLDEHMKDMLLSIKEHRRGPIRSVHPCRPDGTVSEG